MALPLRDRPWRNALLSGLVVVLATPFALYAIPLGWAGLTEDLWPENRFDPPDTPLSAAIFLHMVTGGVITVLAPLQLIAWIRNRAPVVHRANGRLVVAAALVTAVSGAAWIAGQGTIGGAEMSAAFTLYAMLMAICATQTWRFARKRDVSRHRAWALRLVILAIASWLYRVHYGIWYALTGGLASNEAFTGVFDRILVWAFFLPYLALLELWLRRRTTGPDRAGKGLDRRP